MPDFYVAHHRFTSANPCLYVSSMCHACGMMVCAQAASAQGPVMGFQGPVCCRPCLSVWGITSHMRSYHTCPGCAFTQHHRLLYSFKRSSNLYVHSSLARRSSAQHALQFTYSQSLQSLQAPLQHECTAVHVPCAYCWLSALRQPKDIVCKSIMCTMHGAPLRMAGIAEAPKGLPHVRKHEQALLLERLQRLLKLLLL